MIYRLRLHIQSRITKVFADRLFILFFGIATILAFSFLPTFNKVSAADAGSVVDSSQNSDTIKFIIHISVDGLRPDVINDLGAKYLPNYFRMQTEGAFTNNARSDYDFTISMPSHICQLTSRPVYGSEGHNVSFNSDNGSTIEANNGSYIAGFFGVLHDHGLNTAMYASKSKFVFLERSWDTVNGAPDTIGDDNGRNKIDTSVNNSNTITLMNIFIANMTATPNHYSLIHLLDPDSIGHSSGWCSAAYCESVIMTDGLLGQVFDLIDNNPIFVNKTAIILTSDHGGVGNNHSDANDPYNYTIPFYVWGPGVPAGADLYWFNPTSRLDPGAGRPDYLAQPQPVRNGDAANLALDLLDLSPVPGSTINASYDLKVRLLGGSDAIPSVLITSPLNGSIFEAHDTITIEATATTDTGNITKVEFFANWNKLGEDTTSPYSFTWNVIPAGILTLTARAIRDDNIAATASADINVMTAISFDTEDFKTMQPCIYSNTSLKSTRIEFSLIKSERIDLAIYDLSGCRLKTVFSGLLGPGRHAIHFNTRKLPTGLYLYQLRKGDDVRAGRLVIIR